MKAIGKIAHMQCTYNGFWISQPLLTLRTICSVLIRPSVRFCQADTAVINYFDCYLLEIKDSSKRNGIYIQSFAAGLDSVLDPYREILIKLEEEVR